VTGAKTDTGRPGAGGLGLPGAGGPRAHGADIVVGDLARLLDAGKGSVAR
jgi:hypothetical protein